MSIKRTIRKIGFILCIFMEDENTISPARIGADSVSGGRG
jgi:hypothetical protein